MSTANDSSLESTVLIDVLEALETHFAVAWVRRQNSGMMRIGKRFVRFGWPGCPDILGQMKDGRFIGVEVKAPKGKPKPEQIAFLDRIREAGGVAFLARNKQDVIYEIAKVLGRALDTP